VSHVAVPHIRDWVVVDVDHLVEILPGDLETSEVVGLVRVDKHVDGTRGEVTHSDLVRARVLPDLCAEFGALYGVEVLLIGLWVAGVFVQQIGS